MKSFDEALLDAHENGIISKEMVFEFCRDLEKVEKKFGQQSF